MFDSRSATLTPGAPILKRLLGPRPWLLIAAGVIAAGLVIGLGYTLLHAEAKSRAEARAAFQSNATVAAAMTDSVLSSSVKAEAAAAKQAFSGTVDPKALAALVSKSHLSYAMVVNSHGGVIASSPGTPAAALSKVGARADVVAALKGSPTLSNVLSVGSTKGGVIEWALPFSTASGQRVLVDGLDARLFGDFLQVYMSRVRPSNAAQADVVDSHGVIVGGAQSGPASGVLADRRLRAALHVATHGTYAGAGGDRYFVSAPVSGSSWRVVVSEPVARLDPALAGTDSWVVLAAIAALAAAAAAALAFLRSTLISAAGQARANADLRATNATLEERVAERTAAAEERSEALARSNEDLEQFASIASHDLQEPLRKVRMFGDRLQGRLGDDLSDAAADDLRRMMSAAERMQALINDILALSRVGSSDSRYIDVNLLELTNEVVDDLEARVQEVGARVEVGELPVVTADPREIRQLMQNLIGNALKFHREGEQPVVRIGAELHQGGDGGPGEPRVWAIRVEDNGIGFDPTHSDRIFAPFRRLHSRSEYEGTGIGLCLARKIARRHGGDIQADGRPGEGATFTVTICDRRDPEGGEDHE